MKHEYKYLFGPVPSRRFGKSLGIDLLPYKTCSFDCIFCQLGPTTTKTVSRDKYVPVADVIAELEDWFTTNSDADYITLSGSGEPTLHSDFGRIIQLVHKKTPIPVALLTNGSLLNDTEVRSQPAQADVVKLSLSAWDQFSLEHINRPHPDIEFERMVEGQRLLRQEFSGEIWMEVFLVWGTNTTDKDLSRIAEKVNIIAPDNVQLNTAVRPACEEYAYAVPDEQMTRLTEFFDPPAEVIAEYSSQTAAAVQGVQTNENDILRTLQRRPCTIEAISDVFGLHRNEVTKLVGQFLRTGSLKQYVKNGRAYYMATSDHTIEKE